MSRTRKEIARFAKAQKQCARLARRDLERFWKTLDTTDVVACREALEDFLPQLVQAYGNVGGQLAVEWYERLRRAEGARGDYTPKPAPLPRVEAVHARIRSALNPLARAGDAEASLEALSESAESWVKNAARQTVSAAAAKDPAKVRFARVPTGAVTCSFCMMLASRGWIYASEKSAGAFDRYHANCDCQVVPSWASKPASIAGYDPEAIKKRYDAGEFEEDTRKRSGGRKKPTDEPTTDGD